MKIIWHNKCLDLLGQLTTQRDEIKFGDDISVMLDKNIYLGACDYELEVEYRLPARAEAEKIFNILVKYVRGENKEKDTDSGSKYLRFHIRQKQLRAMKTAETLLVLNI
jgi:uncharacterized protein YjbK